MSASCKMVCVFLSLMLVTLFPRFAAGQGAPSRHSLAGYRAIVVSPSAGEVEQTAAIELQRFLRERVGRRVAIVKSRLERRTRNAIVLDVTAPARPPSVNTGERFTIVHDRGDLRITGDQPRAVLQGVFWFERWLDENPNRDTGGLRVEETARFSFRATMPYFTEPGEVTDDYLRFVAASGYNALYLEFHPYRKYINDPLFFPISQLFRLRDFVNTSDHERLVAYVNDVYARAARYGLDGYLFVIEPWGGDTAFVKAQPEAIGKNRTGHLTQPLCLDSAAGVDYLRNLTAEVVRRVPGLKGLVVMSEDAVTICDDSCPRSRGPRPERRATLFKTLAEGGKSVRADFRLVAYTWWWDAADFPVVIKQLPRDSIVCTRTSTHVPYELEAGWKGTPGDVSLVVDGPGRDFQDAVKYAKEAGIAVIDMLGVSNGHELITLPGMPAPDRYARKLDILESAGGAGWITYDCGGLTDNLASSIMSRGLWTQTTKATDPSSLKQAASVDFSIDAQVREVAIDTYGREGAEQAMAGWKACSEALAWFPVELDKTEKTGHRNSASITALAPAVPMTIAEAAAYRHFMKGMGTAPGQNILDGQWRNLWDDRAIIKKYMLRVRDGLDQGVRLLEDAAQRSPSSKRASATKDLHLAEASLLTVRSGLNLLQFWEHLASGAKARTADEQQAVIKGVVEVVDLERRNTERMLKLVLEDRRLFYCACTKYFHPQYIHGGFVSNGHFNALMSIEQILQRKLAAMAEEDFRARLEQAFSGCCTTQIQILWAFMNQ